MTAIALQEDEARQRPTRSTCLTSAAREHVGLFGIAGEALDSATTSGSSPGLRPTTVTYWPARSEQAASSRPTPLVPPMMIECLRALCMLVGSLPTECGPRDTPHRQRGSPSAGDHGANSVSAGSNGPLVVSWKSACGEFTSTAWKQRLHQAIEEACPDCTAPCE